MIAGDGTRGAIRTQGLAVPRTRFLGRDEERLALGALVEPGVLVTVVGAGGSGKTRLAIETAAGLDGFESSCFVDLTALGPTSGPGDVVDALCRALHVPGRSFGSPLEALLHHVDRRRLLLVVDNCEQVRVAVGLVLGDVRARCPEVALVATSREPLLVDEERVLRVHPLSLPKDDGVGSDALDLLCARVLEHDPSFAVTDEALQGLAQVCRDLDGVPLALEFAAGRIALDGLPRVIDDLGRGVGSLTARGYGHRFGTIEAVLAWSWALLTDQEQRVLRRASAFAATFALPQAVVVCGDPDASPDAVQDVLAALVTKSVLVAAPGQRWVLHAAVREFAEARARESGDLAAAEERLTEWVVARVTAAGLGGDEVLGPDLDDVRRAEQRLRADDEPARLALEAGLMRDAFKQGRVREAVERARRVVDGTWRDGVMAARALAVSAAILTDGTDPVRSRRAIEAVTQMASRVELPREHRWWVSYFRAAALLDLGVELARAPFDALLEEVVAAGDLTWEARVLSGVTSVLHFSGSDAAAVTAAQRLVDLTQADGLHRLHGIGLLYLAFALEAEDPEGAERTYLASHAVCVSSGDGYNADLAALWFAKSAPLDQGTSLAVEALEGVARDRVGLDPRLLLPAAVLADRCGRPDLTAVLAGRILEQPPGLRAQLGSKGAADLAALVESVSARGCPPPTGAADERVRAALDDLRTALSGMQARSVS